MKLKVKNFKWLAGKPVIILNEKTARKLNVFQNERVLLENSHDFHAAVDIFPKLIKPDEVGLSSEVTKIFQMKDGKLLDVSAAELSPASILIKKKMDGKRLDAEEINIIIEQIVNNNLTEAEIAYFAAAQRMVGMTIEETVNLTNSMVKTGGKLNFGKKNVVDKHCIGGVAGNRTTPIVVSICAAAGLVFPKTSSRAITSAAGTADVIETISNVELSLDELKKVVNKTGACLAWGGSLKLAPSDDKIIKVERLINLDVESQMIASIMSKKIAAGAKCVLIDIPYGPGAKISTKGKAKRVGKKFKEVAKYFNLKLDVVYTDGRYPVGDGMGPVLEMVDVLKVLKDMDNAPKDLKKKSIYLTSNLMRLGGIKNPKRKTIDILESGAAYKKFKEIINAQNGGKEVFEKRIRALKPAKFHVTIKANKKGRIYRIDNHEINTLCRILGTPETESAGVFIHKKLGKVKKSEHIITLYSESRKKLERAIKYFKKENIMEVKF